MLNDEDRRYEEWISAQTEKLIWQNVEKSIGQEYEEYVTEQLQKLRTELLQAGRVRSSIKGGLRNLVRYNIAKVFKYIKTAPCVLCFDEIDDVSIVCGQKNDVGEMNRIVIALMQEMDSLPNNVIIIGTPNRKV